MFLGVTAWHSRAFTPRARIETAAGAATQVPSVAMKQSEKRRLTELLREAVTRISAAPSKLKGYAEKAAAKFSPTNAAQYRTLAEIVWWLIAIECDQDAMGILDALCEVDGDYYWMFHALGSAFATRAWLHGKQKNAVAAREDARTALRWIHRDPNPKAVSETEVSGALERFDGLLARAAGEKGTMTALRVAAHAMRVLVLYQQFAKAGDPAAKTVQSREYTRRLISGVQEMRQRVECLC